MIDRVRIVVDTRVVAEHVRDWESENVHYNPVHYLRLLQEKPNSLDFGRPFEQWELPGGFTVLRRRLESDSGSEGLVRPGTGKCCRTDLEITMERKLPPPAVAHGRREFIKILRLLEKYSIRELSAAIDRALQIGAMTVDVVRILLQKGRESPAKLFRLDNRPHLQDHQIPEPNLMKYGHLLQQHRQTYRTEQQEQHQ